MKFSGVTVSIDGFEIASKADLEICDPVAPVEAEVRGEVLVHEYEFEIPDGRLWEEFADAVLGPKQRALWGTGGACDNGYRRARRRYGWRRFPSRRSRRPLVQVSDEVRLFRVPVTTMEAR